MGLRAVLFDLDDTLIPEESPDREAVLAACDRARAKFGVPAAALAATVWSRARDLWKSNPIYAVSYEIGLGALEALWGRFDAADPVLGALRDWAPAFRREVWRSALMKHGINDGATATELGRAFQAERRARITAFSDSEPALSWLKEEYRLGLVTNGAPLIQREKLEGSGLSVHFEYVIVSGDIGIGKPDPRVFQGALKALGALAEEALMIGNRLERDIQGAKNVGMKSILIRRPGLSSGSGPSPDYEISPLDELPALLGR
ncbi:MAG: HAD family hydrolase [Chloroflexi bacterium]|nr:HAD family hydrolase [Chloroflexota bacterium]